MNQQRQDRVEQLHKGEPARAGELTSRCGN
jgi:hypothetical protein